MNKSQERTKHSTQSNNKLKCVSMKSFNWKRDKRHIVRFYDEVRDAFVSSLWMIKLWQFFLLRLRLLVISFLVSTFFLSSFCFYLTLFARLEMSMSIRVTPILTRHAKTKTEEQKLISSRDAQMLNLPYRSVNSNIVNIESNGHDKKIDLFEPKKKKNKSKRRKMKDKKSTKQFRSIWYWNDLFDHTRQKAAKRQIWQTDKQLHELNGNGVLTACNFAKNNRLKWNILKNKKKGDENCQ